MKGPVEKTIDVNKLVTAIMEAMRGRRYLRRLYVGPFGSYRMHWFYAQNEGAAPTNLVVVLVADNFATVSTPHEVHGEKISTAEPHKIAYELCRAIRIEVQEFERGMIYD